MYVIPSFIIGFGMFVFIFVFAVFEAGSPGLNVGLDIFEKGLLIGLP